MKYKGIDIEEIYNNWEQSRQHFDFIADFLLDNADKLQHPFPNFYPNKSLLECFKDWKEDHKKESEEFLRNYKFNEGETSENVLFRLFLRGTFEGFIELGSNQSK